jgi:GT2 family glycosyltransferase
MSSAYDRPWIVVLNFNGLADTERCLLSIVGPARNAEAPIIVVDNHSTDDQIPYLRSRFPDCTYIRTQANLGFAGGNNVGVRHALSAGADSLLILNNDTVADQTLIPTILSAAREHDLRITGPAVAYLDEPTVMMPTAFRINRRGSREPFEALHTEPHSISDADTVMGCCILISAEVFDRVGFFDERYFLMHEESELCIRAQRSQHRVAFLNRLLVWHKGSSTFRRDGMILWRYYDVRNLLWLLRATSRCGPAFNGLAESLRTFARYAFLAHAKELQLGNIAAAQAVEDAVVDALLGRGGQKRQPLVWMRDVTRLLIKAGWRAV